MISPSYVHSTKISSDISEHVFERGASEGFLHSNSLVRLYGAKVDKKINIEVESAYTALGDKPTERGNESSAYYFGCRAQVK